MSSPTDLTALQAQGTPVRLVDGSTVHMRYSLGAVAKLERRFGNLAAVMDVVQEAADIVAAQQVKRADRTPEQAALVAAQVGKPSMFGVIADIVLPALADTVGTHPRTRQPFYLGDDPDAAANLLDAGQVGAYLEAFAESFREAFHLSGVEPTPPAQPPAAQVPPAVVQSWLGDVPVPQLIPAHSPGPSGTTPPVGPLGVPMPTSGA